MSDPEGLDGVHPLPFSRSSLSPSRDRRSQLAAECSEDTFLELEVEREGRGVKKPKAEGGKKREVKKKKKNIPSHHSPPQSSSPSTYSSSPPSSHYRFLPPWTAYRERRAAWFPNFLC